MPPSAAAMKKLMRELNELRRSPPEGIRVQTSEEDMLDVTGIIQGPDGTPYAGGYFKVRFNFTEEFPAAPPKCWFATKLFHPNVGPTGEICVNTLKKDWKSTYGVGHILVTVKCLLIYPNPESALDEEAGKMFMEDYESYCSRARLITSVHATPRLRPAEFDTPSKTEGEEASAKSSVSASASSSTSTSTAQQPVASTSKLPSSSSAVAVGSTAISPSSSSTSTAAPLSSMSSSTTSSSLSRPTVSRKSASPAPPPSYPTKSALSADSKQERHPSPSPLGTADANVGTAGKLGGGGLGMGMAPGGAGAANGNGSKAVKRAATGSAITNAEKRKKALKRL